MTRTLTAISLTLIVLGACGGDERDDRDADADVTDGAPSDSDPTADTGTTSDTATGSDLADSASDAPSDTASNDVADNGDDDQPPDAAIVWPDAANLLPPEDPNYAGQWRFFYDAFGTEVLDQWPPAEFLVGLLASEPDVFGPQFSNFGFVPDPGDDLPVGLKRGTSDPTRVHETCVACHIGFLPDGRLWVGAPNVALDMQAFRVAVNERWVAAGNPPLMRDDEIEKAQVAGPGRTNAESSHYPVAVPADFPPYWDLASRPAMNYLGTGRELKTEVYFSIHTFGAGRPNREEAVVPFPPTENVSELIAYMSTFEAPVGPTQDAAAIVRGAEVFVEASCATCHHVDEPHLDGIVTVVSGDDALERLPGDDEGYPRGSIATSPLHRELIDGDAGTGGDEGRADLIGFIFEHQLAVRPSDGYRVPNLRGAWATAPYLHNGSVPTLDDLLRPASERPTTFMRETFEVDTRVDGNGNQGHEFGVNLNEDDRAALIAYLLSL